MVTGCGHVTALRVSVLLMRLGFGMTMLAYEIVDDPANSSDLSSGKQRRIAGANPQQCKQLPYPIPPVFSFTRSAGARSIELPLQSIRLLKPALGIPAARPIILIRQKEKRHRRIVERQASLDDMFLRCQTRLCWAV